jgi:hypothetical protein
MHVDQFEQEQLGVPVPPSAHAVHVRRYHDGRLRSSTLDLEAPEHRPITGQMILSHLRRACH